ncbi:Stage II sporulation protein [Lentibacillus sp. JNUCC-1]|uniref:stage II sporulation protein P n=1 Tax=Lentibacillus sp. JNUCC-1 TaxID=2654513 RepID=UPI0012E9843B|nr:stage II sporulation protein P [Lentibacillus sp. JNUCC-1]MUV39580.1 Stage II sporulation protein [Lentibacillus sp. JNUCC-1]
MKPNYLKKKQTDKKGIGFFKNSGIYIACIMILFVSIGLLTSLSPAYRLSSAAIERWTSEIESTTYLKLLGLENRAFREALPEDESMPNITASLFQLATNMRPNDPRSLLGQEIPGIATFENKIIVAGEGTGYSDLSFESSPPLEDVLEEREATFEEEKQEKPQQPDHEQTTGDRDVVFIYNTHNRESFLPHLPDVDNPNLAYHKEVNITKVSKRLAEGLKNRGIGSVVDQTDIATKLQERGWKHWQSYDASRDVVKAAVSGNKDLQYVIDVHRDSLPRNKTTIDINGKPHANILFVVGAEHPDFERNVLVARELHKMLEKKYPGLSKAVITKEGPNVDGVYNQDLSDRSLLIELGGVDNTLDELYRTADIFAEVFGEFYWDAEKVSGEEE